MFLSTKGGVDGDDFNGPILMQIYSGETDRAGKQRDGAALALFGLEIQPQPFLGQVFTLRRSLRQC